MNQNHEEPLTRNRKNYFIGLLLISVGALFLIDKVNIADATDYWYLIPAVIACSGLIEIISSRQPDNIAKGCFNIILAFWLYASVEHLWGWTFRTSWPVILIAFGARSIIAGLLSARK
ncbi:LiaF transmembrane domain-containing protein [Undibacterium sp. WLHG33]|uniref:LiaF transmembrane domain-containing protein n=1 Tax=Undibacterium sp. WLHG33 TaxID=3412482 RepID=UPI003C2C7309